MKDLFHLNNENTRREEKYPDGCLQVHVFLNAAE